MRKFSNLILTGAAAVLLSGCSKTNSAISEEDSERIAEEAIEMAMAKRNRAEKERKLAEAEAADALASPNPVTQYLFIEVDSDSEPGIRSDLAKVLKNRNFSIKKYPYPDMLDSPYVDDFKSLLVANRQDPGGNTNIKHEICDTGERVTINFASNEDAQAFIESLEKAKYKRKGDYYAHPKNRSGNMMNLYVRVKGTTAVIRSQNGDGKPRF